MKVLLGDTSSQKIISILQDNQYGRLMVTNKITPYKNEPWGFDNGAFVYWRKNIPFDGDKYLKMLDYAITLPKPYLAILPDIVAGGNDSLDFSLSWLDKLPKDWPWYLAAQDGMDAKLVIENIHSFSGLFLGGSDEFKQTANYWRKIAHVHKKKFHYGRAGTYRKIQHAHDVKADSLDSAFPLWTQKRFREFILWLTKKPWEQRLFSLNELHQEY